MLKHTCGSLVVGSKCWLQRLHHLMNAYFSHVVTLLLAPPMYSPNWRPGAVLCNVLLTELKLEFHFVTMTKFCRQLLV